jgi:hypothetical protein
MVSAFWSAENSAGPAKKSAEMASSERGSRSKSLKRRGFFVGTPDAHPAGIVASLRKILSTAIITVALTIAASGPVIAGVVHQACAAKHHGCASESQLTWCCCGKHGNVTNDANMPPSGNSIVGDECSAVLCFFWTVETPSVRFGVERIKNLPPSAHPLDLPILFADHRL